MQGDSELYTPLSQFDTGRVEWCRCLVLGGASVPELDSMWQKLADSPQVLQQMFSVPYTKAVLEGLEANPSLAEQVNGFTLRIR